MDWDKPVHGQMNPDLSVFQQYFNIVLVWFMVIIFTHPFLLYQLYRNLEDSLISEQLKGWGAAETFLLLWN